MGKLLLLKFHLGFEKKTHLYSSAHSSPVVVNAHFLLTYDPLESACCELVSPFSLGTNHELDYSAPYLHSIPTGNLMFYRKF